MDLKIPGYSIESPLQSGGLTQVFSATRNSDSERVAVKVLKPRHSEMPALAQRFLQGCAIHEKVQHPNIVTLHEFGELEGRPYAVESYLPGGNLLDRLANGISIQAALKYIKDIARALDAVHEAGAVHGDVKPENIMFNAAGEAVLIDFNVARPALQEAEARRGNSRRAFGTAEYMAPEQAAAQPVDGRADLYSLGAVLFRLLTGAAPYAAGSAAEIGVRHLQDPIPRLPEHLTQLQPLIDKALAKRREQRFQTGQEFVRAIDEVRTPEKVGTFVMRTNPISTQEIRALGNGSLLATPRDAARHESYVRRTRRNRATRLALLAVLLIGGISYSVFYGIEKGLIPVQTVLSQIGVAEDPRVSSAWSEAQSLHQDPNQALSSVVAAYRRVLAIAPEHEASRAAVAGLASDWKTSIREAMTLGNLETASTQLNDAIDVFPEDVEWLTLKNQIQNRQRAERILESTQSLLRSHGLSDLPSATAAIQSYQEVLRLAPGHPVATSSLTELSKHYAGLATQAITTGELNDGMGYLERATAADATVPELDAVRKLISQATTARAAIDDLLQQARRLRSQNQLMSPPGENAAELYHRVLASDPGNAIAIQGRDEITAQVAAKAEQLRGEGRVTDADALYTAWSTSSAGGTDHPPQDAPYGLREGAHLDEDANLLRYGSPLD